MKKTLRSLDMAQGEADANRHKQSLNLTEEQRNKIKVMEQAIGLLAEHKIPAYLFGVFEDVNSQTNEPCHNVMQFNTIVALAQADNKGDIDKNTSLVNYIMVSSMCYHLINSISGLNAKSLITKPPTEEMLVKAVNTIAKLWHTIAYKGIEGVCKEFEYQWSKKNG